MSHSSFFFFEIFIYLMFLSSNAREIVIRKENQFVRFKRNFWDQIVVDVVWNEFVIYLNFYIMYCRFILFFESSIENVLRLFLTDDIATRHIIIIIYVSTKFLWIINIFCYIVIIFDNLNNQFYLFKKIFMTIDKLIRLDFGIENCYQFVLMF